MLIPDPDPAILKFTVEPRQPHPFNAEWNKGILIALPEDSNVLLCGLAWDEGYLHPWLYDNIKNIWSYKLGEERGFRAIPELPCPRRCGSGCSLGQAVYLFCGLDEDGNHVEHIDRLDLRSWSEWKQIPTL